MPGPGQITWTWNLLPLPPNEILSELQPCCSGHKGKPPGESPDLGLTQFSTLTTEGGALLRKAAGKSGLRVVPQQKQPVVSVIQEIKLHG